MKLSNIISKIKTITTIGKTDLEVKSICFDSREVKEGSLFVALKGETSDGHDYIEMAIKSGACAIVCEKIPSDNVSSTIIHVENSHIAL